MKEPGVASATPLELLDGLAYYIEDFLTELRSLRQGLVNVDQALASLASLNAQISEKQQQLAILDTEVKEILAKLHLRSANA